MTIEALVVDNVQSPPRAKLIDWNNVCLVARKPPREKRVIDNNPAYYRNFERVGIDG
ncbi:MAG: hypothetical protein WCX70_00575 [Candidatus Paceibacterota bacterium]